MASWLPPPQPVYGIGDQLAKALVDAIQMSHDSAARDFLQKKMAHDLATMKFQEKQQQIEADRQAFEHEQTQKKNVIAALTGQPGTMEVSGLPGPANTLEQAMAGIGPVSQNGGPAQLNPMVRPDMSGAAVSEMQNPMVQFPVAPGQTIGIRPLTQRQIDERKSLEQEMAIRAAGAEAKARTIGTNEAMALVPKPPNPDDTPRKLTNEEKAAYTEMIKAGRLDPNGTYTPKQLDDFKSQFNADRNDTRLREQAAAAAAERRDAAGEREATRTASLADKSYNKNYDSLKKYSDDLNNGLSRMQRLEDTLAQPNMVADSVVAPEFLIALAGGQGTGLRINEAEIDRVIGGRPLVQDLRAKLNKIAGGDTSVSILPEERQKMQNLITVIKNRGVERSKLIDEARDKLLDNSEKPALHKQIMSDFNKKWDETFTSGPVGNKTPPPVDAKTLKEGTIARKGDSSWVVKGGQWVPQ